MGATTQSYIIASRITQGHQDWDKSTPEERQMIIDNYMRIKDDPQFYKIPSSVHQSTSSLVQKMHSRHSETDVSIAESQHSHHSLKDHLHLHHHKSNHSSPELDRDVAAESETSTLDEEEHAKHKLSLKGHHFPHLHKHREETLGHSMSEVELPKEHKEMPMVQEAEIRQVLSM